MTVSETSLVGQQAAAERAMDGLEAQADIWAEEVRLVDMVKTMGDVSRGLTDRMPLDVRRTFIERQEAQIDAIARQAYLEGFYRGGESRKAYDAIEYEKLATDNEELNATFDLQWEADQRAIKSWQAAHPGKERTWPDRCCMVIWLMEQLTSAEAQRDGALSLLSRVHQLGQTGGWRRMPGGVPFSATELATEIASAIRAARLKPDQKHD